MREGARIATAQTFGGHPMISLLLAAALTCAPEAAAVIARLA
jgi:hypothetical protein